METVGLGLGVVGLLFLISGVAHLAGTGWASVVGGIAMVWFGAQLVREPTPNDHD